MKGLWKKRGDAETIEQAIKQLSGAKLCDLKKMKDRPPHRIDRLDEVCSEIAIAISDKTPISVIADYDNDGIAAATILHLLFQSFNVKETTIIPKRMSEGYGAKPEMVEKLKPGLLIMVDNGITAFDAVKKAKDLGFKVIILDHHVADPRGLPDADIIIDPSAIEGSAESPYYCGAGLALCVMLEMIPQTKNGIVELRKIKVYSMLLAGIATIADCVPLLGDNRWIVQSAAEMVAAVPRPSPLASMFAKLGMDCKKINNPSFVFADEVGFKVAPCFNAFGRLEDDGANEIYNMISYLPLGETSVAISILCDDFADKIIAKNDERKELTKEWSPKLEKLVEEGSMPLCIYAENIPQGLVGIFAGRLAEKHQTPCIVFTESVTEPGILHGSARSYGGIDIKAALDKIADKMVNYGGHAGAAGITVEKAVYEDFRKSLSEVMKDEKVDTTLYYDVEINEMEIEKTIKKLESYAPFGQSVPMPIIKINHRLMPGPTGFVNRLGADKEHMKFSLGNGDASAVGFFMARAYEAMGQPRNVSLYGTLGLNFFNGEVSSQFQIEDFEPWEGAETKIETPLAALLKQAAALKS